MSTAVANLARDVLDETDKSKRSSRAHHDILL